MERAFLHLPDDMTVSGETNAMECCKPIANAGV